MQEKKYLQLDFEFKSIESDQKFLYFKGYASTFNNIDRTDDSVVKGAFKKSLEKKPSVKVLWQHSFRDPIGKSLLMREDEKGLYVEGRISKRTSLGKDVAILIEDEVINQMSIGYYTKDSFVKENIRYLTEIDLFEFSFVTEPANEMATLSGFKSVAATQNLPIANRDMSWDSSSAEMRIRDYTNSKDQPSEDYKKYFMYYNEKESQLFGSYKLLFADVVDGVPHIIPRAIYAIAGVLNGARGGVDIPNQDRSKIQELVNQLYRRLADKFDDTEIESPLDEDEGEEEEDSFEFTSIKDIEKTLRDKFSQKKSKIIISKIKEFSMQRDAEEKQAQRDVELKQRLLADIQSLTKSIKQI
jgi:HK97 family phage prohead protease